jgi:iron complex transport system substrate-binding protein
MIRAILLALLLGGAAQAKGVVSLNLCTDQFLLALAPERIAALSFLARDATLSVFADAAKAHPWVRADAEAVLALEPDMVLAANWGAQATLAALERHGTRVVRSDLPESFAAIRAETMRMGQLLGVSARAAELLAEMDGRLAKVTRRAPVDAVLLEPRGYTGQAASLADEIMRAAGYRNVAVGMRMSLEQLATLRPALLVMADAPAFPSLATDFLRHPVLAHIATRRLPPALLVCGGPWTAAAVAMLAQ